MSGSCRLRRSARLCDEGAIAALIASAHVLRGRWFVVRWIENGCGYSRLLIRVGKKAVRAAVFRNRLRRLAREMFRLRRCELSAKDYLVMVRSGVTRTSVADALDELERLLRRAK